jgi:hypothetical protein
MATAPDGQRTNIIRFPGDRVELMSLDIATTDDDFGAI